MSAVAVFVPGSELAVGDVIVFFGGELHPIDHGLIPPRRIAVDPTGWSMTIPDGLVPCLRTEATR